MRNYSEYEGFKNTEADTSVLFDSQGRRKKQLLFYELNAFWEKYPPVYTLRNKEYKGLPSAYLIYMNSVDEYDAALKLVGNLDHWRILTSCEWFIEPDPDHMFTGLAQWREDMKQRDASIAKAVLMKNAMKGDTNAAKAMMAIDKETKKERGRPTKEVVGETDNDVLSKINNVINLNGR